MIRKGESDNLHTKDQFQRWKNNRKKENRR